MTKQHATIKSIRQNWKKVFYCGYCDLQDIFYHRNPQYYNAGIYGWNCDIYCDFARDIAITTGYRNMTGRRIPDELLKKYGDIAKEINSRYFTVTWGWEEKQKELEENAENFLNELDKI